MQRGQAARGPAPELIRTPSRRQAASQSGRRLEADDEAGERQALSRTPGRPVLPKTLQTGVPLTPQTSRTPGRPKLPLASAGPVANGPRRPAAISSGARQPVGQGALFNPSPQYASLEQQQRLAGSETEDDDEYRRNGVGGDGGGFHGRQLQRMPSSASYGSETENVFDESQLQFDQPLAQFVGVRAGVSGMSTPSRPAVHQQKQLALVSRRGGEQEYGGEHDDEGSMVVLSDTMEGAADIGAPDTRSDARQLSSLQSRRQQQHQVEDEGGYGDDEAYLGFSSGYGQGRQGQSPRGNGARDKREDGLITHSPCGGSLVYGVSSEQVNPGGSATVAPQPPAAGVKRALLSPAASGPTSAGPGPAKVITARPRDIQAQAQGGYAGYASYSYPAPAGTRQTQQQRADVAGQEGEGEEDGPGPELDVNVEVEEEREVLYGHIAGLRPRPQAGAPTPVPTAPPAAKGLARTASVRSGRPGGTAAAAGVVTPSQVAGAAQGRPSGRMQSDAFVDNREGGDSTSVSTGPSLASDGAERRLHRLRRYGAEVLASPLPQHSDDASAATTGTGSTGVAPSSSLPSYLQSRARPSAVPSSVTPRVVPTAPATPRARYSALMESAEEEEEEQGQIQEDGKADRAGGEDEYYASLHASRHQQEDEYGDSTDTEGNSSLEDMAREASRAAVARQAKPLLGRQASVRKGNGAGAATPGREAAASVAASPRPVQQHVLGGGSFMSPSRMTPLPSTPLGDVTNAGAASAGLGRGLGGAKSSMSARRPGRSGPLQQSLDAAYASGMDRESKPYEASPGTAVTDGTSGSAEPTSVAPSSMTGSPSGSLNGGSGPGQEGEGEGAASVALAVASTLSSSTPPMPRPRPYFLRDGARARESYRSSIALNDYDYDVVIIVHVPLTGESRAQALRKADAEAEARAWAAARAQPAGVGAGLGRVDIGMGRRVAGVAIGRDGLEVTVPLDITLSGPSNEWSGIAASREGPAEPTLAHTATGLSGADSSFTLAGRHGSATVAGGGGAGVRGGDGGGRPQFGSMTIVEEDGDMDDEDEGYRVTGAGVRDEAEGRDRKDSASDTDSNSGSDEEEEEGEDSAARKPRNRDSMGGQVWTAVERVAAAARASLGGLGRPGAKHRKGQGQGGRSRSHSKSRSGAGHRRGDAVVTVLPRSPVAAPTIVMHGAAPWVAGLSTPARAHANDSSLRAALSPALAALGLSPHLRRPVTAAGGSKTPVDPYAPRPHKCAEILKALKRARLQATRLRSLSKSTWLIGIKAPEWRLELEAEKLRLRMRRRDGGWSKFKRRFRDAFVPAVPSLEEQDESKEGGAGGAWGNSGSAVDDPESGPVDGPGPRAHAKRGRNSPIGASTTLFHSSDRQTLINHILRSSVMEGGADLGVGSPLGAYVTDMFPVHMYARLVELRSDWLAIWRPQRSQGEHDRIGLVDPAWYAPPQLLDIDGAGVEGAPHSDVSGKGKDGNISNKEGSGAFPAPAPTFFSRLLTACLGSARYTRVRTYCGSSSLVALLCNSPPVRLAYTSGVIACKAGRSVGRLWKNIMTQPLDRIAAYFGETIAFYFAWLEFYTQWLVLPSIVGVLLFLGQLYWGRIDIAYVPLFSLFMSLWSILFLEFWKRRNAELAQRWGVLHYEDEEAVRPQFAGAWKSDAATGEVVRLYPAWKRVATYAITAPIVLAFVAGMVLVLIAVYSTRDTLVAGYETEGLVSSLRAAVMANSTLANAVVAGNLTLPEVPVVNIGGVIKDTWTSLGMGIWAFLSGRGTTSGSSPYNSDAFAPFAAGEFASAQAETSAVLAALASVGLPLILDGHRVSVGQDGGLLASAPAATAGEGASESGWLPNAAQNGLSLDLQDLTRGIDLARFRSYFDSRGDWRWWAAMTLPPVALGLLMPLIDHAFARLALVFNDYENHATESEYRNHRIAKVFFFRFTVSFISLFYYAFSPSHSLVQLAVQLATFCVVGQAWNNALEGVMPAVRRGWRECRFRRRLAHAEESGLTEGRHGRKLVRHATAAAWTEYRMPVYDSFNDYAELLIQFGYVSFFSWAFPLAPACALINNILEMRSDAYKLCHNTRRPVAHKSGGIGVWYNVLVSMSLFAVLTNCAHLALASRSFDVYFPGLTQAQKMLVVFVFEHCVLALKLVLPYVVPATPASVKWRMARDAHATAKLHSERERHAEAKANMQAQAMAKTGGNGMSMAGQGHSAL